MKDELPWINSPDGYVAEVFGGAVRASQMERFPSIRRANAQLIAAAPDLLAACKMAIEAVDAFDKPTTPGAEECLRVAIAKAEGQ
jgi:hypothetical protein